MALYVIADLHLSCAAETDKSMEVFGDRWANYTERLYRNWTHLVAPEDTVIVPGDISWALTLPEAREDLAFIDRLPRGRSSPAHAAGSGRKTRKKPTPKGRRSSPARRSGWR